MLRSFLDTKGSRNAQKATEKEGESEVAKRDSKNEITAFLLALVALALLSVFGEAMIYLAATFFIVFLYYSLGFNKKKSKEEKKKS